LMFSANTYDKATAGSNNHDSQILLPLQQTE